jgi:hypothetical protein
VRNIADEPATEPAAVSFDELDLLDAVDVG